jgi:hypothetical protein
MSYAAFLMLFSYTMLFDFKYKTQTNQTYNMTQTKLTQYQTNQTYNMTQTKLSQYQLNNVTRPNQHNQNLEVSIAEILVLLWIMTLVLQEITQV